MQPIVTFIGWHNSGKTTVIRRLVRLLRAEGMRVGVMKSTKHSGMRLDRPGSDTFLLREDGADAVALVAPDQTVLFQDTDRGEDLAHLAFRLFQGMDLVIAEGFKNAPGIPKIEVARKEVSTELLKDHVPGVIAVVSDFDVPGIRNLSIDDSRALAAFVKEHVTTGDPSMPSVSLFVNGRRVPLTYFVQNCLAHTLFGFIGSLRSTQGAEEIELKARLKKVD